MTFTKAELEVIAEVLEWAVRDYRLMAKNSPEQATELQAKRAITLHLVRRFNTLREG